MSNETTPLTAATAVQPVITADQLLNAWQGHRRLTRKVIEAFPEKELFEYAIGGMRPFAAMVVELLAIAGPGVVGMVTNQWEDLKEKIDHGNSKSRLLELWDETTEIIDREWPKIPAERFQEQFTIFGQYPGYGYSHILYFIDNEIHHRGQAYVYLRALGIEPPFFWER